jgi:hypothetical protein
VAEEEADQAHLLVHTAIYLSEYTYLYPCGRNTRGAAASACMSCYQINVNCCCWRSWRLSLSLLSTSAKFTPTTQTIPAHRATTILIAAPSRCKFNPGCLPEACVFSVWSILGLLLLLMMLLLLLLLVLQTASAPRTAAAARSLSLVHAHVQLYACRSRASAAAH